MGPVGTLWSTHPAKGRTKRDNNGRIEMRRDTAYLRGQATTDRRSRRMSRVRVRREQRERHRGVEIADHGIRKPIRIDLPPTHRLGRRGAGESARVRARISDL